MREGFHGRTLRDARYRYTEWAPLEGTEGAEQRELYDLELDPFEHRNLASSTSHAEVVSDLATRLAEGWRAARP